MPKEWARTALVLAAIVLMLLVGIAVQRARIRAHHVPAQLTLPQR
jgi:hypothetical protein